jgi:hypothetical protein
MTSAHPISSPVAKILLLGFATLAAYTTIGCNRFRHSDACGGKVQQVLPGPQGGEVEVVETTCHGTDEMQIFVSEKRGSSKVLAFAYDRMNADPAFDREDVGPSVTWIRPDLVRISIDMVAYVRSKRSEVGQIKIEYGIGRSLYPETYPRK